MTSWHHIQKYTFAKIKINTVHVNVDKTKYMVMSQDQKALRSHSIKTDYSSFGVEEFKNLGITLTNQNSIQE